MAWLKRKYQLRKRKDNRIKMKDEVKRKGSVISENETITAGEMKRKEKKRLSRKGRKGKLEE